MRLTLFVYNTKSNFLKKKNLWTISNWKGVRHQFSFGKNIMIIKTWVSFIHNQFK